MNENLVGLSAHFQRQIASQIWNKSTGLLRDTWAMLDERQTSDDTKWFMYTDYNA